MVCCLRQDIPFKWFCDLALSVLLLWWCTASASAENRTNRRFDPDNDSIGTVPCTIPPYQNLTSIPSYRSYQCPNNNNSNTTTSNTLFSPEELHQLAVAYAPVLFFHPLEKYALQSVEETLNGPGKIKYRSSMTTEENSNYSYSDTLNQTSMLLSAQDLDLQMQLVDFFIERINFTQEYESGSAFDEISGLSQAPIYYNSFYENHRNDNVDNTNTSSSSIIVFNYYFHFAVQGGANILLLRSLRSNNTLTMGSTSFIAPSLGSHQGQWQTLSVRVCRSPTIDTNELGPPLAVSYPHNHYTSITDCSIGECTLYKDTVHPVGFVALESHFVHPVSAYNLVHSTLETDLFSNLQGILFVDRTVYKDKDGRYRWFFPNDSNLRKHAEVTELEVDVSDPTQYWQGYTGKWGADTVLQENNKLCTSNWDSDNDKNCSMKHYALCLSPNQTSFVDCPTQQENKIFTLTLELLGILPPSSDSIVNDVASDVTHQSVQTEYSNRVSSRGPVTHETFRTWMDASNGRLWDSIPDTITALEYCTSLFDIPSSEDPNSETNVVPLPQNVLILIYFFATVTILNILFFASQECFLPRSVRFMLSNDGIGLHRPGLRLALFLARPTLHYTIFYVFSMMGISLMLVGYRTFAPLLMNFFNVNLNEFQDVVQLCSIFLIIIDSSCLVFLWATAYNVWMEVQNTYNAASMNIKSLEMFESNIEPICFCRRTTTMTSLSISTTFLFVNILFSALIVVFNCFNIGIAYGMTKVCAEAANKANEFCINLDALFPQEIVCGTRFSDFCNDIVSSESDIVVAFWGSFVSAAGHFYLVGSAAAADRSFRHIWCMLDMWQVTKKK